MKYFGLFLFVIGYAQAISPGLRDSDNGPQEYDPAELCQPWVCRAPECKCTSTDSGGSFPVEKTPQV